ncbi:hypothetical protein GCM10010405_23340 [Streptomyces macrosporus]|uniref:Uncharacterized protein n=1 Tax=Streptomyces macrosporus TaxID=44032 RepID=A0ABP5WXF6_9ACTN
MTHRTRPNGGDRKTRGIKRHPLADTRGAVLVACVSAASVGDRDGAVAEAELLQAGPARPGPPAQERDFAQVGAGLGMSEATAWRYVGEALEVLAAGPAQSPGGSGRRGLRHR